MQVFYLTTVDEDAIRRLDEEVADLKRQLRDIEQPLGTNKAKLSDLKDSCTRSTQEMNRIKTQLKELQARANQRLVAQRDLRKSPSHVDLDILTSVQGLPRGNSRNSKTSQIPREQLMA